MIPKWLARWGESRQSGRKAFIRWFLVRRASWLVGIPSAIQSASLFQFVTSVLGYSNLRGAAIALGFFVALLPVGMVMAYVLGRFVWFMNERRYVRDVLSVPPSD